VVLAWSVALLVEQWQQRLEIASEPLPLAARVQPMPEPKQPELAPAEPPEAEEPPEPAAEPEPAPEPKPAPEPQRAESRPTPVSARDFTLGSGLLDGGGAFPALSFGYEEFPSFVSYARAMVDLGARFVVVRNREIVGSVDLDSRSVGDEPLGAGFSPRARDYTSEPGLASVAAAARERFGGGSVVMMLVPRSLDAGLFGGLARVLSEHGESHAGLSEVRGSYQRVPGGGVRLRVDRALRRDGSSVDVEAVFDLRAIAGGVNS
jgi:hypothetical protein